MRRSRSGQSSARGQGHLCDPPRKAEAPGPTACSSAASHGDAARPGKAMPPPPKAVISTRRSLGAEFPAAPRGGSPPLAEGDPGLEGARPLGTRCSAESDPGSRRPLSTLPLCRPQIQKHSDSHKANRSLLDDHGGQRRQTGCSRHWGSRSGMTSTWVGVSRVLGRPCSPLDRRPRGSPCPAQPEGPSLGHQGGGGVGNG